MDSWIFGNFSKAERLTTKKRGAMAIAVTFLTAMHMALTALVLVRRRMEYFEKKSVGTAEVMKFGVLNSASIALLNLSLGFNSVLYQMTKLSIIPFTVGLQMKYLTRKKAEVKMSLLVLLQRQASTVTDVQLNATGSVVGVLSVSPRR